MIQRFRSGPVSALRPVLGEAAASNVIAHLHPNRSQSWPAGCTAHIALGGQPSATRAPNLSGQYTYAAQHYTVGASGNEGGADTNRTAPTANASAPKTQSRFGIHSRRWCAIASPGASHSATRRITPPLPHSPSTPRQASAT
jgi:hypothetical protein